MAPFPMSVDTYGLEFDCYRKLFVEEAARLLCLYFEFDKSINETSEELGCSKPFEKTKYDLFTDVLYATNDDARKLQRKEDPDGCQEKTIEFVSPTRKELKEKMDSLSSQIEELTCYVGHLATITKANLTNLVD